LIIAHSTFYQSIVQIRGNSESGVLAGLSGRNYRADIRIKDIFDNIQIFYPPLCMVANIHTRNLVDILRSEISKRGLKTEELQNRVTVLEKNINSGINIYSKDP
jgi:hypothetical protein